MGINRNFNIDRRNINVILVAYTLFNVTDKCIAWGVVTILKVKFDSLPLDNVCFLISYSIPITCNLTFFVTVLNLFWRQKSILKILKSKNFNSTNEIKILSKVLHRMSETISLINQYHMFNIIISLMDILNVSITITFLLYDISIHSLNQSNFFVILGGYCYAITSGLIYILITAYSSKIVNSAEEIAIKINQLGVNSTNKNIQKISHLTILNYQNSQSEISCGLFTLNWNHLFTMIASFFSYLITMIQFDSIINGNN